MRKKTRNITGSRKERGQKVKYNTESEQQKGREERINIARGET